MCISETRLTGISQSFVGYPLVSKEAIMESYEPDETTNLLTNPVAEYVRDSTTSGQSDSYVVYKRRWYILAVVVILNISNAMIWISFSPIADITATFYSVDASEVNWFALIFMVASIPCGFGAIWILDSWGLRTGIILASWLNLIGSILRVLSGFSFVGRLSYTLAMIGQGVAACSQCTFMFAPTKVAALWFSGDQRAIANTIASMANPLGILVANLLSPFIAKTEKDLPFLMDVYTIPAVLGCLMATFGICSSVPPSPPTPSAAEDSDSVLQGLKKVIRIKSYWVLAITLGAGLALFTTLSTLLEQILCARGYTDDFAGICGALLIGVGVIGAGLAGVFVDKTKMFEEVAKVGFGLAALSGIFFAVVSRYPDNEILIGLAIGLFGFFGFAIYPVCLELAVECTYPVAEATSSGFLIISGQIQGIIYILLMQVFAQPLDKKMHERQTCESGSSSEKGITPQDYTYSNIGFCSVTVIAAISMITFFKCEYKRLAYERQLAAENILNFRQNHSVDINNEDVIGPIYFR